MVDVHVVRAENSGDYARYLDGYHRARHRIYIEELGWRGLQPRDDGREFDQFDTDAAIHLIAVEDGRVVGGSRLMPSIEPHLMSEVFPHLAEFEGPPRRPDVYEWTRVFTIPERREEHSGSRVTATMIASLMEFAVAEGLAGISVVMSTVWLPRFLRYGWKVRPLGLPQEHEGEVLVAVLIDVDERALAGVREQRGVVGSHLRRHPAGRERRCATG